MRAITRKIEIDAGHRIPDHSSKCRHIHGHRYFVEATVRSKDLVEQGSSKDMVIDFGFLKQAMVDVVDKYCDHTLILSKDDPLLNTLIPGKGWDNEEEFKDKDDFVISDSTFGRIYVIGASPTAEVLAEHWFLRLKPLVQIVTNGLVELYALRVYETPNCWADYPAY